MGDEEEIMQLLEIAQVLRDRDLGHLSDLLGRQQLAKSARENFAVAAKQEDVAAVDHLGYRRDHELTRRVWRERRLYALGHYEARAAALVETQRLVSAKSFGRAMVLEQLAEQFRDDGTFFEP